MNASGVDDEAFVAAFLSEVLADQVAGRMRPLDDYLERFPGREPLIRRTWAEFDHTAAESDLEPEPRGPGSALPRPLGPYELIERIGTGGQGDVYLALDRRLDRKVAIKVLHSLAAISETARARFRREASLAARLDHPGICTLFDVGFEGETPYLVLRYLEGRTLADLIATGPELSLDDRVHLIEAAARALHAAHEAGVLHRDLKPSNLLITRDRRPVILDFGLARATEGDTTLVTATGDLFGTPAYLAPELLRESADRADRRSDVYALGTTLYELTTGRRPHEAPTRESLLRSILQDEPTRPGKLARAISEDLEVVILTALAKSPDHRYQTAIDFAEDLRRITARESIHARRPPVWRRFGRWVKRKPVHAAATAFLILALALAAYLVAKWKDIEAHERLRASETVDAAVANGFLLLGVPGEGAISEFERALAINPYSEEALAGRILAWLQVGRAEEALMVAQTQRHRSVEPEAWAELESVILDELGRTRPPGSPRFESDGSLGLLLSARSDLARGERGDPSAFLRAKSSLVRLVLQHYRPHALHYFMLTDAAIYAKDAALAATAAETVSHRWPHLPTAMALAGRALVLSDPKRAVALLDEAWLRWPDHPAVAVALGEARLAAGDVRGSVQILETAAGKWPTSFEAWTGLAEARANENNLAAAAAAYERAHRLAPQLPSVPYNLGVLYLEAGDFAAARPWFEVAVSLNPEYASAHNNLGMVHRQTGNLEAAADAFRKAAKLDSSRSEFVINRASTLLSLGWPKDALTTLDGIMSRSFERVEIPRLRAQALRKLGRLEEAVGILREATRLWPDAGAAWSDLGECLAERGEFEAAKSVFRVAVAKLPGPSAEAATLESAADHCDLRDAQAHRISPMKAAEVDILEIDDPVALASAAAAVRRFDLAFLLWTEALRRNPKLGEDLGSAARRLAAFAAVQCATELSENRISGSEYESASIAALNWIRADLVAWQERALSDDRVRPAARIALQRYLEDPGFAPARRGGRLSSTRPESRDWPDLWAEMVRGLENL